MSFDLASDSLNPVDDYIYLQTGCGGGQYAVYPQLGADGKGRIMTNAKFGTRTYERVLVSTDDTTRNISKNCGIWRVYFSNPGGIIAFEYRGSNTIYWRN